MPRYVAFLRAINVGGHTVKMDHLRRLFERLGFSKVETFIASGNVIFESASRSAKALEKKIEAHLQEALGYRVATFLRSTSELADIARYQPFGDPAAHAEGALYIGFLADSPSDASKRKFLSLASELNNLHCHGREVYWLCRTRMSESRISMALLEKTLGMQGTFRNATTVRKLALKYAPRGKA